MTTGAYCCTTTTNLVVLDASTAAVLTTLTLAHNTYMAAVSPNGGKVAVSETTARALQFVTVATNTVDPGVYTTSPTNPSAMAWAPDNSKLYVFGTDPTDSSKGQVEAWTPAGGSTALASFPVTYNPQSGMCISPDGTRLFCNCGDTVRQIDIASGAVTIVCTFPTAVRGDLVISPDGTKLYASNNLPGGLIYPVTIATGIPGTALSVGGNPVGLAISPDGLTLWSAQETAGQVQAIATASFTVTHTLAFGDPYELAISPDGATVLVGDLGGNAVIPVDTATFTAGTPTSLGGSSSSRARGIGIVAAAPPPPPSGTAAVAVGPLTVAVAGTPTGSIPFVTGTATVNLGPFTFTVGVSESGITTVSTARIVLGPLRVNVTGGRTSPGAFPVPGYRGRWRLTLHTRKYAPATLMSTIIAELADARARTLTQTWNTPAQLVFTLDGQSPAAALVDELLHDVVAWRWDDQTGSEIPVFRGIITQSEDQITEQSHVVTFTCHDYAAMLTRRLTTRAYTVTGRDQDDILSDLLNQATNATPTAAGSFSPASFLPLSLFAANPDGSLRGFSGRLRDRTYYPSQNIGTAVDDLAVISNGFDWDVQPSMVDSTDRLRVFYPAQGVTRTDVTLQYGSTVATVGRTINSAEYANYVRVLGNSASADPNVQLYAETWTSDATATTPTVGLWMADDNASNVTVQTTLNEKAGGDLALDALLVPHYTLGLAPDAYTWGNPNMGDTVPLIVQSGRLNIVSVPPGGGVRVLGITYAIGDDGQEDVTLTVARPKTTLANLFTRTDRRIKALDQR